MRFLAPVLIWISLTLSVLANPSVPFKEERYIYAIDKTLHLEGFITFTQQSIIIEYTKPEAKVLTYFEEKLSLQDQKGYRMIDTVSNPMLGYFLMIIKAIHEDNLVFINSFFEQKMEGSMLKLTPKGVAANVLDEVLVERKNKQLKSLHVKIKNGDRISIDVME